MRASFGEALGAIPAGLVLAATRSRAAQFASHAHGTLVSTAIGTTLAGEPYDVHDLAPGYCMSRIPLLAAVVQLAGAEAIDIASPLARYVDLPFVADDVTVAAVLEHQAGLRAPDLLSWRMMGPRAQARALPDAPSPAGPGYSDLLPGLATAALIESVASAPVADHIATHLLCPAGASGLVTWGPAEPIIHPAVAGLPTTVVPFASELLSDQISDVTPATGTFACAEGLARLLAWLFFEGPGATRHLEMVSSRQGRPRWDPVLGRTADYALGFMSDLASVGVHGAPPSSFGHTAAIAGWLAVVEPDHGAVLVAYSNGALLDADDGVDARNILYAALTGDHDRLGPPPAAVPRPRSMGIPATDEPLPGLTERIGVRALPRGCDLDVELRLRDTGEVVVLAIRDGALASLHQPGTERTSDVALIGDRATLAGWLADPAARLGDAIWAGTVSTEGALWFVSALEYWAARTHPSP